MNEATKKKVYGGLSKIKKGLDKASKMAIGIFAAVSMFAITAFAEGSGAAAPTVDLSSVDFSGLTASITSMVPQVLPVAVTVLGIRKAISFMMSTIRGC